MEDSHKNTVSGMKDQLPISNLGTDVMDSNQIPSGKISQSQKSCTLGKRKNVINKNIPPLLHKSQMMAKNMKSTQRQYAHMKHNRLSKPEESKGPSSEQNKGTVKEIEKAESVMDIPIKAFEQPNIDVTHKRKRGHPPKNNSEDLVQEATLLEVEGTKQKKTANKKRPEERKKSPDAAKIQHLVQKIDVTRKPSNADDTSTFQNKNTKKMEPNCEHDNFLASSWFVFRSAACMCCFGRTGRCCVMQEKKKDNNYLPKKDTMPLLRKLITTEYALAGCKLENRTFNKSYSPTSIDTKSSNINRSSSINRSSIIPQYHQKPQTARKCQTSKKEEPTKSFQPRRKKKKIRPLSPTDSESSEHDALKSESIQPRKKKKEEKGTVKCVDNLQEEVSIITETNGLNLKSGKDRHRVEYCCVCKFEYFMLYYCRICTKRYCCVCMGNHPSTCQKGYLELI